MDKSVAQITTVYDQELAECCNMMRAMIGDEEGGHNTDGRCLRSAWIFSRDEQPWGIF